ncbi:MAG: beta-ribofuranosylaminobenzene 5'-phosphate synthase family protein [Promethearchaeota archaeon]
MASSTPDKVLVRTTARLHLGFIDLHGGLGRKFGSLGVSLQQPECIVEVTPNDDGLVVSGQNQDQVKAIATQIITKLAIGTGFRVTVRETIPAHVGLGSGTQLGLAIGTGLSTIVGVNTSVRDLSNILWRGLVSGVGTATFEVGGFVIDGGKVIEPTRNQKDMVPPLIFHHTIPEDWIFVIAVPNVARGLSGEMERKAFRDLPVAAPESAQIASRLLLMKLLPAIVDDDIERFGEALTQIQILVGEAFASAQGGRYASPVINDCIKALLDVGALGAGQSSWGPTCYGLVRGTKKVSEVKKAVQAVLETGSGGHVFSTPVNNQGAKVIIH